MNLYDIEVTGQLRLRVRVQAKDVDSAHAMAALKADDHLRDDGELVSVNSHLVGLVVDSNPEGAPV